MDEKFFDGLDRHVWLLGLVRGWVAAVRHVDGDALMRSRCTPVNERADESRTKLLKIPCASRSQTSAASTSLDVLRKTPSSSFRSPGSTAWSLR
ncbi:hypothetical protein XANMN_18655 [Xanthomonas phaseoli pv. manihotis str. CIO151]|nr:hypothetical protein XANMN_18655 [Xanthomonas phaseoli pv. manihotis str. CIO151]